MNYKKNSKFILFVITLLLTLILVGCKTASRAKSTDALTGTQGLVMNFLPNRPPDKIVAEANELEVPITIEVRNKGAFPSPEASSSDRWTENDVIFVSGYDPTLFLNWNVDDKDEDIPKALIARKALDGKSILNPEGGYDTVEFVGELDVDSLKIDRYKPGFLVTACYHYVTRANPTVCIDNNPYSFTSEEKVCEVSDIALTSQGAPIAVTKAEEEVLKNSIQFKIYFKNVGGGDVIAIDSLKKCMPDNEEKLDRKDMDFVKIENIKVSDESIKGTCKPIVNVEGHSNYARLFDNEGFIICSVQKDEDIKTAYTTPLSIELSYGYRTSISKTVEIINVPTG